MKYYRLVHKNKGQHYFMVTDETTDVVKVTTGAQPKKGRPYCLGITRIKYTTFISSYAWNMNGRVSDHPNCKNKLEVISKKEYESAFNVVIKALRNP